MNCLGKFDTVVSSSGGGGGGKWAEIIGVCSSFCTGRCFNARATGSTGSCSGDSSGRSFSGSSVVAIVDFSCPAGTTELKLLSSSRKRLKSTNFSSVDERTLTS